MILGEDKNKVSRIVDSSWEPLIELYQDCLENDQFLHAVNKTELEVDLSSDAIKNRVSKLPHRCVLLSLLFKQNELQTNCNMILHRVIFFILGCLHEKFLCMIGISEL